MTDISEKEIAIKFVQDISTQQIEASKEQMAQHVLNAIKQKEEQEKEQAEIARLKALDEETQKGVAMSKEETTQLMSQLEEKIGVQRVLKSLSINTELADPRPILKALDELSQDYDKDAIHHAFSSMKPEDFEQFKQGDSEAKITRKFEKLMTKYKLAKSDNSLPEPSHIASSPSLDKSYTHNIKYEPDGTANSQDLANIWSNLLKR